MDTAHLSAGKQKIQTRQEVSDWIEQITNWDYIGLLHLNGNEYDPNVRAGDKHCIPSSSNDKIWGNTTDGYKEMIQWHVKEQKKDAIVEVNCCSESSEFINSF